MIDETNSVPDGNTGAVPAPASAGQPPGGRQIRAETLGVEDVEPWPEPVDGRIGVGQNY